MNVTFPGIVVEPSSLPSPVAPSPRSAENFTQPNPIEMLEVDTLAKVAYYFPQTQSDILQMEETAQTQMMMGVQKILSIPKEQRTFANTFFALDAQETLIKSRIRALDVVAKTYTAKEAKADQEKKAQEIRDAADNTSKEMKTFLLETQSSKVLFQACQDAYDNIQRKNETLSVQQRDYLEKRLKAFKKEGVHLMDADYKTVKELKTRISQLQAEFSKNLAENTSCICVEEEGLKGIPQRVKDQLEKKDGRYVLTCKYPVYIPVMKYCEVEQTRKDLYHAFDNRAADRNIPILRELISVKNQLARLLGYRSYADLELEDQMAKTPKEVQKFIEGIIEAAKSKAQREISALLANLPDCIKLTSENKIKPWDIGFLLENYKTRFFNVDEKKLQEYFPLEPTLDKLLKLFAEMFKLDFKMLPNKGLWSDDLKVIAVYSTIDKNRLVGHVILDLFPRDGKFGHAYCLDVLAPCRSSSGDQTLAIAVVLENLTPENKKTNTPSLLMHSEATGLFHELGHALHQLLGCPEMPSLCGYHTTIDFLELPSQILEELMWDPKILQRLGEHYVTHQRIPEELIQDKIRSKNFAEGYFALRQMVLSTLSLEYFKGGAIENTGVIREVVGNRILPFIEPNPLGNYEGTFEHLVDPLYGSRYYCYSWAEVFAADIFEYNQEQKEKEPDVWLRYRRHILEPGGGTEPGQLLRDMLGREPSMAAYNKRFDC